MKFNYYGFKAIYLHEMDRFKRTLMQSLLSPVLSTSLYFIVFGSVIGGYVENIDGISYGSYIVPGLLMLTLLTQSISNTSFGIFFPKFNGTIYEILAAPISTLEIVLAFVGAGASKTLIVGVVIFITATFFVEVEVKYPLLMIFSDETLLPFSKIVLISPNTTLKIKLGIFGSQIGRFIIFPINIDKSLLLLCCGATEL